MAASSPIGESPAAYQPDEQYALQCDARDPVNVFRDRFHHPKRPDGEPVIYFAGNSLGLQPRGVRHLIDQELKDWSEMAVDAHFRGSTPWYTYPEVMRESMARRIQ